MMKGQITMVNMMALFVTFILFLALAPIINDAITPTVAYFEANPNSMSPMLIPLIWGIPFFMLLSIIITVFNYAAPQREGF